MRWGDYLQRGVAGVRTWGEDESPDTSSANV